MQRTITVAALQLAAHDLDAFDDVWPTIRDRVADTAKNGASLIVLPEATIPAYVLGSASIDMKRVERALLDLRSLAEKFCFLAVCGAVRADGNVLYNSAVAFGPKGAVAGYADKVFLWHFDRRWFAPGQRIAPIRTDIGSIGVLVCADGRMPQVARKLVDDGAEILVMPTAWVTSGRDVSVLENVQADLLARVRARENGVPFVAANKSGVERGCVAYCGKSQIVAADGTVVAMASQHQPGVVTADIVLGPARPSRAATHAPVAARARATGSTRVAITPFDADERTTLAMELVEATQLVAPGADDALQALDRCVPTMAVDDATVADPGGLVPLRRRGYRAIVWNVGQIDRAWIEPLARARALELRLYVVVVDRDARAFAVDPDGAIVAGTFDAFRIASFVLDPARAEATLLAPGTDVADGLERVAALVGES
ncbi:MAG TPA: carbon-nitrogen hydrolase family protein [Candidatus Baltobacteraceae bacterium]